ncbi:MAG TPA: hypothetical protein VHC90_01935 [Bryobacteraceae bacterium]|nr:hypothetical protein [Bryobacteraceae bacterium]
MGKRAVQDDGPRKFGVYQKRAGSYTLGPARFEPLKVTPVSPEVAELACEDESPVKFFDAEEDAAKNVEALKAKFDKQPKNPVQE